MPSCSSSPVTSTCLLPHRSLTSRLLPLRLSTTQPKMLSILESEHDEELNYKDNAFMSVEAEADAEAAAAEAGEESVLRNIIEGWWKENSSRFPILANMARDILAIPITTVASESAFSTSGRILDDFRTSLTPFIVQALVCTQDGLRRSTDPVNIKENLEELEVLEKELIEEFGDKVKGKRKVNGGVLASSMAKSNKCASRSTM